MLASILFAQRSIDAPDEVFPKYFTRITKEIPDTFNEDEGWKDEELKMDVVICYGGNWGCFKDGFQCMVYIETNPKIIEYYDAQDKEALTV